MSLKTHLTIGQVAEFYDVPAWKIRRVVDSLDGDIPRIGRYRLVPRTMLGMLAVELERQGWLSRVQQREGQPS